MNFLLIIVGPSGVGKNTLIGELRKKRRFGIPVSCTTRAPQNGEAEGVDYYFRSPEEFGFKVAQGDFAEFAEVHGNLYGTLNSEVENLLAQQQDILLDVDVQGALQLKERFKDKARVVSVFVLPPTFEELKRRMAVRNRGETHEEAERRLVTAREEIKRVHDMDYYTVNNRWEWAVEDLVAIVDHLGERTAPSMLRFQNPTRLKQLLATL